tara:strand:- start:13585 stop:14034 length:450 start_codon:yes stop_codon:yes gene_type:complete
MKELTVTAIKEGTVIDHLPPEMTFKVIELLNISNTNKIVSIATNLKSSKKMKKGLIKVGGKFLTKEEVDKIAIIAPDATVNIIKNYEVIEKNKVSIPDFITNIIKCSNPRCITNHDKIITKFSVTKEDPLKVRCYYCERYMGKEDLELV